jgi:hypothetical protein
MLHEIPPSVEEQCLIDVHQLDRRATQQAVADLARFEMLIAAVKEGDDLIENV